jgi:hypothetical protein
MLRNQLYRGQIAHKGNVYEGEHAPIIDATLWDAVQSKLAENRVGQSDLIRNEGSSLLVGLAYDSIGNRLTPTHAKKGSRKYRYYVSERLVTGTRVNRADGQRIPAGELEGLVAGALQNLMGSPADLHRTLSSYANEVAVQSKLLAEAEQLYRNWNNLSRERVRYIARAVITRIDVHRDRIEINVRPSTVIDVLLGREPATPSDQAGAAVLEDYLITVQASLQRAGQEMRLVIESASQPHRADPTLVKLIGQALQFRDELLSSQGTGVAELAARAGISGSHFTRVLRLGFLAPDILTAIVQGRQPVNLTATQMLKDTRLPLCWVEQRNLLGFPQPAEPTNLLSDHGLVAATC